jgi:hypothetical protein
LGLEKLLVPAIGLARIWAPRCALETALGTTDRDLLPGVPAFKPGLELEGTFLPSLFLVSMLPLRNTQVLRVVVSLPAAYKLETQCLLPW